MRKVTVFGAPFLATLGLAGTAAAAGTTKYVSPTGTGSSNCTYYTPCELSATAGSVVAGDTVILMDGVYKSSLIVGGAGGTETDWITFKADDCATPIIEGNGAAPDADDQNSGVGAYAVDPDPKQQYLRFIGLVSRGWSAGFSNQWVDDGTTGGHYAFDYCIGDGNGRTGFTFFKAEGIEIKHSIAAHNGSSTLHSWSSGVTLLSATGAANLVEGNVSFENMDAQKHTDGSGFIVDEASNNAKFINNVAFLNGGSCLRLTKSSGTVFVNNTCYHDAQDVASQGPPDPSELYFTGDANKVTGQNVTFLNNVLVNTGTGPGGKLVVNQPESGWTNNTTGTGTVAFFTAPDGMNPDFTLAAASALAGKGMLGTGVPTDDVGFDPKCLVKKAPTPIGMMVNGSWWAYSIDYDYIKSLGGVKGCFRPKQRGATLDNGAYANGAVTAAAACVPAPPPPPPMGGMGGMGGTGDPGAGGTSTAAGGAPVSAGGTGNVAGAPTSAGGGTSVGGTGTTAGGTTGVGTGGSASGSAGAPTTSGGSGGRGGATSGSGATGGTAPAAAGGSAPQGSGGSAGGSDEPSGCGCRIGGQASNPTALAGFGFAALAFLGLRRRRQSR